jgi:hypothetical protein
MQKAICFLFIILLVATCQRPEVSDGQFTIIGTCELPGYAQDLDIQGQYAYVANSQAGLQIVNITDPASPYRAGGYEDTQESAIAVAVRDSFAYIGLSSGAGLLILDIRNPSAPDSEWYVGEDGGYTEYDICAPPDTYYVYIAAHDFFIVENCSTQFPYYEQRIGTPGTARGIFVGESYAYLACEQMGLNIYFAARPDTGEPVLVGSADTPSNARDVFVVDEHAYVADGRAGLVVMDVAEPENPQIMNTYDTPEYANDVFVSGTYAYVADGAGGVQIFDISIPEEPVLYAQVETAYANAIYVENDLIYVADRDMGLVIIEEEE